MMQEQMMQAVWAQLAGQLDHFPNEAKEALRNLEINIVKQREGGELRLVAREITPGNPNSLKAADELFTTLIGPISFLLGAFHCKISVYK